MIMAQIPDSEIHRIVEQVVNKTLKGSDSTTAQPPAANSSTYQLPHPLRLRKLSLWVPTMAVLR